MIHEQIKKEIKEAMLKKETLRLLTLRGLLTAFVNELIVKKKKPNEILSDEDALNIIKRSVKQRKDSIQQFKNGNREDLAKSEEAELAILETYLPKMMNEEEIKAVVIKIIEKMGATDKTKIGMLTGAIMKELKGKADGSIVKKIIESQFP